MMEDDKTTVSELKEVVKKFCEERDWDQFHNPKDLAIGISTEANELLALFRFKTESDIKDMISDPKKRNEIGDELADILYFVLRFAQMNNFDLSEELKRKIIKNNERYPVSKAKGSNKKYNEV
jgi:NTP pyrophosphatase (non-canonical NTP hydrolase)